MIPLSLRQALLEDLRPDHQSVDDLFSGLDLTHINGLTTFLKAQYHGLTGLLFAAERAQGCRVTEDLAGLCTRVAQDLAQLDTGIAPPMHLGVSMHPRAVEYIFLGSRLGGRILKRRWQASTDPRVLSINLMFNAPDPALKWRDFCDELSLIRAASPLGERIIADARSGFHLFAKPGHITTMVNPTGFSAQRGLA